MDHRSTVVTLAALVLAGAGCSSPGSGASTPGVTATTVTIGSHQPLSGPFAAGFGEIAPAAKAYFDYVNDKGGVNGRKIIYDYQDDASDPANTVTVVHKLVEKDKVFAIFNGFGTAPHRAVVDYLNDQKVPDLFPASGCTCWNNPVLLPYTFGWQTDSLREGKILGAYVAQSFKGKRVAYLYTDDIDGNLGVRGLDKEIPASSVVIRQIHPSGSPITAQSEAIAQARADVIVAFISPSDTVLLRSAQQKLGDTARLVVSSSGIDLTTPSGLPSSTQGNPLIQGVVTDTFVTPFSDNSSGWTALAKRVHARYEPSEPFDQWFQYGMAAAYTFVQTLQRAGKNPTRSSLTAGLQEDGLDPGPGLAPLDYSHTSHGGYTGAQIASVRGDTLVRQGLPVTTDDGTGPVIPYTPPLPEPPTGGIPTP
ncbi:ABC transporter substrate-binding protein [Streptacidiphilus rugosus]|uniref:ABC transporter substrate-binding protein n=1 Tax=Streptacidiphilus rugosus TaxID=405783 RepID=UPI0005663691|nr:ABC transporter substrate-binding protein [Streptacidiphilus rugosus]